MKTREEILKATEELTDRIEGKRNEAVDEPSLLQLLNKSLDYIFKRGEGETEEPVTKSEAEVEKETAREEEVRKSEEAGEEEFLKGIVESPAGAQMQEYIDAAPLMEALTDQIAKSMGAYEAIKKAQAETDDRLAVMEEAMGTLLKSHEAIFEIMKEVRDQPVSKTSPGFFAVPANREATGDTPADLKDRVLKSVQAGKLDPKYYSWFDTRTPDEIFAALPAGALD